MKVRFSLYEKEGQKKTFKELKDMWGECFLGNKTMLQEGIIKALKPLENQFKTVLERENITGEISFDIYMKEGQKEDRLHVQFSLLPRKVGLISVKNSLWFRIGKALSVSFPVFDLYYDKKKEMIPKEIIEQFAHEKTKIISSDIARDGLPKEMKQAVAEIKRGLSHLFTEFSICL